jgi:hypothetical protein
MMMDDPPFEPDRALFQRWREAAATPMATAPDALMLAAYAEGRLTEAESEQLEAALAVDPELLDTLLALRRPAGSAIPSAALIQSAQSCVPDRSDAVVVPFRGQVAVPAALGRVTAWLAWGAVAASLLLVSMAGFDLGVRTQHAVNASASYETPADLLDPSSLSGDDIG